MTDFSRFDSIWQQYVPRHADGCMALFESLCPHFFAPNEKVEFAQWLKEGAPGHYLVDALPDGSIRCAFGLMPDAEMHALGHLHWVMVSPTVHGHGFGRALMDEASRRARDTGFEKLHIAASHLSAPFFARFGAAAYETLQDGWGPGMHRVNMRLEL